MSLLITLLVGGVFVVGLYSLWVRRSFHHTVERDHEHTYVHHPPHEHTPSP